jgi:hypothetical protein
MNLVFRGLHWKLLDKINFDNHETFVVGNGAGFHPSVFSFPPLIIIPPLVHTHYHQFQVYNSPLQAAHNHIPGHNKVTGFISDLAHKLWQKFHKIKLLFETVFSMVDICTVISL